MWQQNIEQLAYHDLDGRSSFKLALQEVDGRFFLYVGALWHSGWSVLDVTDPTHPELLRWIEGPANTWTIQVQVADGKMVTALEHIPGGWSSGSSAVAPQDGFYIWDVGEPDRPKILGHWRSEATGTHRNFYNGGQYVYATTTAPGFNGHFLAVVDTSDPTAPITVGRWWYPGQHRDGGERYTDEDIRRLSSGRPYPNPEKPSHALSLHGGAYVLGPRAYCPWMRAGLVTLDVSDPTSPRHISTLPVYPPLGSSIAVHSAVPVPNRGIVVINSEALHERCAEPAGFAATVDMSDEFDPIVMAVFPKPRTPVGYDAPSFAAKGGRFGPHNQHQQQGLECLAPTDRYIYLTYFNAGLQVYDIEDPRDPYVTAYFIPDDPKDRRGPLPSELVHQAEDVLVDRRGIIYMSEKNSGVYVLKHQTM